MAGRAENLQNRARNAVTKRGILPGEVRRIGATDALRTSATALRAGGYRSSDFLPHHFWIADADRGGRVHVQRVYAPALDGAADPFHLFRIRMGFAAAWELDVCAGGVRHAECGGNNAGVLLSI